MTWTPTPQVVVAQTFAKRFGANRVIIFYSLPDGRVGYASYGRDGKLCRQSRAIADEVFDEVESAFVKQEASDD